MALPPFIQPAENGCFLKVKLQPRASKNQIGPQLGEELKISVTAPPVDAAANEALVQLLAKILKCSRGAVEIVRGQTSRHKTLFVRGIDPAAVAASLQA